MFIELLGEAYPKKMTFLRVGKSANTGNHLAIGNRKRTGNQIDGVLYHHGSSETLFC